MRKSTIGRSGHQSWRGWPRVADRGRVRRTPPIGKGVAACYQSVERGSDAATTGRYWGRRGSRRRPHRNILPTILHHNKNIFLAGAKTLRWQKKGIETCFSTRRNLTTVRKTGKHVFVGTKIYYGPNPNLALIEKQCIEPNKTPPL